MFIQCFVTRANDDFLADHVVTMNMHAWSARQLLPAAARCLLCQPHASIGLNGDRPADSNMLVSLDLNGPISPVIGWRRAACW